MLSVSLINLAAFRYKLYLENEDDEVGAVMETGSVGEENEEEEDNVHHGKENQRPNNQIGRLGFVLSFSFKSKYVCIALIDTRPPEICEKLLLCMVFIDLNIVKLILKTKT